MEHKIGEFIIEDTLDKDDEIEFVICGESGGRDGAGSATGWIDKDMSRRIIDILQDAFWGAEVKRKTHNGKKQNK